METWTLDLNDRAYTTRAAILDDIDLVVDLINAAALHDSGMTASHREDKLIEWGQHQFCLETDTLLVLTPDGQVVGCVELWHGKPYVRVYLSGRVHPDHRGQGIGTFLMQWAETRAWQGVEKAPAKARVSMHTNTIHENQASHDLFRARGFRPSRHFFRMLIEMTPGAPPPAPTWPEGVSVRPYVLGQDDRSVHKTIDRAFQDHWGYVEGESFEEWFHWIENDPSFDPSVCFLAVTSAAEGEQTVGVLMARPVWEEDPTIAWIDELGVLRPWRRQGIALALLLHVFGEFYRRDRYKVGLGVDGQSLTGATRLYEKAGMYIFRQLDAYEKVLRPGQDLSTKALED